MTKVSWRTEWFQLGFAMLFASVGVGFMLLLVGDTKYLEGVAFFCSLLGGFAGTCVAKCT